MARTTRENIPAVTRPSNVPTTVWSKMAPLQKYNLSKGLLVYDKRTKKCKKSHLSISVKKIIVKKKEDPLWELTKKKTTKKKTTKNKNISLSIQFTKPLTMVLGDGLFKFSDGSVYIGKLKNGLFHGNGTRTWKDGSIYTGAWRNGERHGQGRMVHASGEEYIGQWKNDSKSGRGTMFHKNGSMYVGDWKDNLVENQYTKQSEYEKSLEAYKLYKSFQGNRLSAPTGTYEKIGKRLGITRLEANRRVNKHKDTIQRESKITKKKTKKRSPITIDKLDLAPGITSTLKKYQIYTLRNLTEFSEHNLRSIPNIGSSAVYKIKKSLKKYGLELKSRDKVIDVRDLSLKERRQLKKPSRKKLQSLDRYGASMARYYD